MIYILWCTIRPEQFIVSHKIWVSNSTYPNNFATYVAVNTNQDKKAISNYNYWLVDNKMPSEFNRIF